MIASAPHGPAFPFIGRAAELAEISARLSTPDCRLLTLIGIGGSGKTRLALEAARLVGPQFAHGAAFVALQPLARSDLLVAAIAQALGLAFYSADEPRAQLLDYLADKTLLLLLDNFEHLLDGAALIGDILAAAPGITVLATSREALGLREEWRYPLKGLAAPLSVYTTALEGYEAVQLFLAHARRTQPHFALEHEREAVIRICMMTAGLPLALELAASWLRGSSATQIAQEMQRSLDLLASTARNVEERHRSMRAVFDQSWGLLAEHEQQIFARLAVFVGGFDTAAAAAVAEASFASLAALVEKSLVQMEGPDRFGLHELLRQYALERLGALGQTDAAYARHSAYYAQWMAQSEAALKQPQQLAALQAIERDFANIRQAWEWSVQQRQAAQLHAMLNSLYLFGFLRSRYRETSQIFEQSLEPLRADSPLFGRLQARRWGYLHWWYQTDGESTRSTLADTLQALAIAQAGGDRFEIAFCNLIAAYAMISSERYADALPYLEASCALFIELGEPYYVCWVQHRIGYAYTNLNEIAKGIEYTERSLALARSAHNRVAQVICLYNLGSDYILCGDYTRGRQYCAEALEVASDNGHRDQIAHALSLLALCDFCEGMYDSCQRYAERAQAIVDEINSFVFEPYNTALLILLACLQDDTVLADWHWRSSRSTSTNQMGVQLLHWALAALACGAGNLAEARAHIQQVLDITDLEENTALGIWLLPCAAATLAESDPGRAAELLAWVHSSPDAGQHWGRRWPLAERLRAQLQAQLGPDIYRQRWQSGAALGTAAILAHIQAEPPAALAAEIGPAAQLLTAREHDILRLMATGLTNPQIAAHLVIGAGTVKTHTLNIYRKLEVANRTQAITRALALGLLRTADGAR